MNVYTNRPYDERSQRLALGIDPRDAEGDHTVTDIDVRIENDPRVVELPEREREAGRLLGTRFTRMLRHRSGRFGLLYRDRLPTRLEVRVVDEGTAGSVAIGTSTRRVVPRRLRVDIATEQDVVDADIDPAVPPHEAWRRVVPCRLYPGASAAPPTRSTVLRGRITRFDPALGRRVGVPWCRVRAQNTNGDDVGWAHGDDRGEFVLVARPSDNDVVVPPDPMPVTLTIGATLPPLVPDADGPRRPAVDPLWDLPIEQVTVALDPANEPTITGRRFLPEHAVLSPLFPTQPIDLPHGRETTIEIPIA